MVQRELVELVELGGDREAISALGASVVDRLSPPPCSSATPWKDAS
jgi:hypothetical protein